MNDQASRIKQRRRELQLTQKELASRIGVTREAISIWENNPSVQLGSQNLEKLAKALSVATGWILYGKREKVTPGNNVIPMHNKAGEFNVMEPLRNYSASKAQNASDYRIPILAVTASAGHGAIVLSEATTSFMEVPREILRAIGVEPTKHLRIINVRGDSMLGTLNDGDLAIVDLAVTEMQDDGVYIFQLDGYVHIKRLQHVPSKRIRVISDNPLYESYDIDETHDFQICARFLGRWAFGKM
ncbi:helix-turn-helix domain-containing protein [Salinicola corii]|uniref:Helix-turn-helix domain-containing protein n=1 Tax=Salinicola corii TaxID=2606937 RepID=A0A640WCV9_9GAMM|nr:S24 family peptidase [Salinicola corii]KAA0017125.1 helix-turn-helix domain-containing protein [Salinicola corii]